jgi:hypothetical protein
MIRNPNSLDVEGTPIPRARVFAKRRRHTRKRKAIGNVSEQCTKRHRNKWQMGGTFPKHNWRKRRPNNFTKTTLRKKLRHNWNNMRHGCNNRRMKSPRRRLSRKCLVG